jgi:hypothetical protein
MKGNCTIQKLMQYNVPQYVMILLAHAYFNIPNFKMTSMIALVVLLWSLSYAMTCNSNPMTDIMLPVLLGMVALLALVIFVVFFLVKLVFIKRTPGEQFFLSIYLLTILYIFFNSITLKNKPEWVATAIIHVAKASNFLGKVIIITNPLRLIGVMKVSMTSLDEIQKLL